jgi:hypothetical protein
MKRARCALFKFLLTQCRLQRILCPVCTVVELACCTLYRNSMYIVVVESYLVEQ